MDLSIIRIVLLASYIWGVHSLRITKLTVPNFVKNGSTESVLLDCEYEYQEKVDEKLIVKWFHDDDRTAVYQWIPEHNSKSVSEKFGDRINTDYEVPSGDDYTKHRALNLLRPTTEMSGKYSCEVTSMNQTVVKSDEMTIYATPTKVSINISSVDDTVSVMCIVEGVYPFPDIDMFLLGPAQKDPSPINKSLTFQSQKTENGAHNVFLTTNLSDDDLDHGFYFFGCTVTLDGTDYRQEEREPYDRISGGYRPGLRRKIHSDASVMDTNDAEHWQNFVEIGVAAQHNNLEGQSEEKNSNDDDDDDNDNGALEMRPSVVTILIIASALLVLCW